MGIYMDKAYYPSPAQEKNRYLEHHNNVDDPGYRNFVSPITRFVFDHYDRNKALGLDFGSGSAPVISKVLLENGFKVHQFDPFFSPESDVLNLKFDFITCCEVIEHFHDPAKEFESLKNLLKPSGTLLCMTQLYYGQYPFKNWYYRRDPTHTFIFSHETIEYVANKFNFDHTVTNNRFITFVNR